MVNQHVSASVKLLKSKNTDGRLPDAVYEGMLFMAALFMYENLIAQKARIQTKQLLQLWRWQTTDTISRREWNYLRFDREVCAC